MESKSESEGITLSDIEITISLRSGSTDLALLKKLMQVIVTSATSHCDGKIVRTESSAKVVSVPGKVLTSLTEKLYKE